MKSKLGTQLYILIFLIVTIALSINSYFDYKNIKENYLIQAYFESQLDIDVVKSNLKKESNDLDVLLKKISNNVSIQNSLNLISNYQNKSEYNAIVFDEEKKTLLNILESKINTLGSYSFALFDKDKDLLLVNRVVNNLSRAKGIVTYEKSKRFFYDLGKNEKSELPYIHDINKDKIDEVTLKLETNAFSIRLLKPIYLNDTLVGYIRAKKRFSKENINILLQNVNNNFSFYIHDKLLGSLSTNNLRYILENADNFNKELHNFEEMFNDENYFYHAHYLKTLNDNKLYFIAGIHKSILDEKILALLEEFSSSFFISIILAFLLAFLFVQKNISRPLSKLMSGIKELKKGNYTNINLQANNELKEISLEFNDLTSELEKSFVKIDEINKFLENILDTVPVRIFWKDKDGKFLGANRLFIKDLGLNSKEELIGKTDFELVSCKDEAIKYANDDRYIIQNNKEISFKERKFTSNDRVLTLLTSKLPLKNIEGEVIGVLGVYEDITKQKEIEKELKDKDLILFEQSKLASMGEMIENIAHQWRQPLSMITTSATGVILSKEMDLLTDKVLIESLKNITTSAKYLSNTIDDFRSFYNTDNEQEVFDIKNCFDKSSTLLSSKFKNREITIISELDSIPIRGYENELIQVFINILNNAKDALDTVENRRLILITSKTINNSLFVSIKDSAGGIPENIISRVFEHKFTTKQENNGTGIGLYMSSLIMKKAKGKISVQNCEFEYKDEHFKGAEFILELPISN